MRVILSQFHHVEKIKNRKIYFDTLKKLTNCIFVYYNSSMSTRKDFYNLRIWRTESLGAFDNAMKNYQTTHPDICNTYVKILRNAMWRTISTTVNITPNLENTIRKYIANIPKNVKCLAKLFAKYPNAVNNFLELDNIDIKKLWYAITPKSSNSRAVNKSCTRWMKNTPITPDEMNTIAAAGYKNPGAFPYSWIEKIPACARGTVTQKLHEILKRAAIKLYSASDANVPTNTLKSLGKNIEKLLGRPMKISILGRGAFAKTFIMQIPGDKKYVWKIYHCDNNAHIMHETAHDTEIQNSFLLGGKKYGKQTRIRSIATAGISTQRGEMYIIYPYVPDATGHTRAPQKRFADAHAFQFMDLNPGNVINNTVVDLGAIYIDPPRWHAPRFVSKIIRTVLYNSWNDIGYILNNYNSTQIGLALTFMDGKISHWDVDYDKIMEKIEFLKRRARIR